MDKKDYVKYGIIGIVILIIIGICIWLLSRGKIEDNKDSYDKVTTLEEIEDATVRDIYHQFNPEEGILFDIIGSNGYGDLYGYYYSKDIIKYEDLSNVLKSFLALHSYDYKNSSMYEDKECYEVDLDRLKNTYGKIFKGNDDFKFEYLEDKNPRIEVNDNIACISDNTSNDYTLVVDTYFDGLMNEDDNKKFVIREKVAFITMDDKKIYYYSDYDMKNLVYSMDKSSVDTSFIGDADMVSNVLVKYKDKFNSYNYTFVSDGEHYTFESIGY